MNINPFQNCTQNLLLVVLGHLGLVVQVVELILKT